MSKFESGDLVRVAGDDSVWHVLQVNDTQASIKALMPEGGWALDLVSTSTLTMLEKNGGLPPNRLAEKFHIAAMRIAASRHTSYQEAIEEYGYQVDMSAAEEVYGYSWKMVFSKAGQVVYKSVFMQNVKGSGGCKHIHSCPILQDLTGAEKEDVLKWRCRWRWADTIDCPEGPRYTPKIES